MLKVDGILLPEPSINASYGYQDLQCNETYRDLNGRLHKETVRYDVRKITVGWKTLRQPDVQKILNAIKNKEWLRLEYFDPHTGTYSVMEECYVGDRTMTLHTLQFGVIWQDFKVSFIER